MKTKLLTILALLLCFYAGKRFSDFEHRPIVVELHLSHSLHGQQQADRHEVDIRLPAA